MTPKLAELHVHFQQCIRPRDLLAHLAITKNIDWDWYEEAYLAAYGIESPARQLVERYRRGDMTVINEFNRVALFDDYDASNFSRFLAKSNLFWAGAYRNEMQEDNEKELLTFAKAIRDDFINQNISYAEFRMSALEPALLKMFDTDTTNLTMRLAISLNRENPWDEWEKVKEMVLGENGKSLTAIDFCKVEEGFPPKNMANFFNTVKEFNKLYPKRSLAILYHVGESFNDKSLQSAIRWVQEAAELGAHRLGHAIALGVDPAMYGEHTRRETVSERKDQISYDLKHQDGLRLFGINISVDELEAELQELNSLPHDSDIEIQYDKVGLEEICNRQGYAISCVRATGAIIEICPTSNMRIANIVDPIHHPIHRFIAEEMPVVVSTDDPGVFGITLAHELDWIRQQYTDDNRGIADLTSANSYRYRSEKLSGREA